MGQRAIAPYPSVHEMAGDAWAELSGYDGRIARTLRLLMRRPGALTVNALQGDLDLTTVNGKIAIAKANGAVRATTVNGGIEAELADVSDDLRFETVNGGVELRLPAGSRLTLDASMAHGVVRSDFQVAGADPKKRNVLKGDVNGGGSRVTIRTVNGGIQLSEL